MQPFQQRVVDEKSELDAKLAKLNAFASISNAAFAALSLEERGRLIRQQVAMQEYSDVLGERIAAFNT